jgi:hypothetical protein
MQLKKYWWGIQSEKLEEESTCHYIEKYLIIKKIAWGFKEELCEIIGDLAIS